MQDEERYEHTTLHSSGPLPGFPGPAHGPGPVVLDKLERRVYSLSEWEAMQANTPQPQIDDRPNEQADVL